MKTLLRQASDRSLREKLILAGLFLSRFDSAGLAKLGFESFVEAFNVIGYALGAKPASVKNYRDEFDPLFPNARQGWHKRQTRQYCLDVLERYAALDLERFAALIASFLSEGASLASVTEAAAQEEGDSAFARRLMTGIAAEKYFRSVQPQIPLLENCFVEDTTRWGCGYDFRLSVPNSDEFFAVEVKGLRERTGNIALTSKEHAAAASLSGRFLLFVVKNFRESPFHATYWNPLAGDLLFSRREQTVIHVSWQSPV
jgi:hypothetical protein